MWQFLFQIKSVYFDIKVKYMQLRKIIGFINICILFIQFFFKHV